jgi:hypothetical protein
MEPINPPDPNWTHFPEPLTRDQTQIELHWIANERAVAVLA